MAYTKSFRAMPFLRGILLINVGGLLLLLLRVYVLQSATWVHSVRMVSSATVQQMNEHLHTPHQQDTSNCSSAHSKKKQTSPVLKVPNIVHYIWYTPEVRPLQFHHLLSILSALKILKPDVIYFHTDREPIGQYWDQAKTIPNFKINFRSPPATLFGEPVKAPKFYTSHSNVDRVKILMEFGGIYLDFDTLVIRPLDDLRQYDCTIGLEQADQACGSIIICHKEALFLTMWLNSYLDDYRIDVWAYNTGKVPYNLARRYPHLAHVEETRLNRPNFAELEYIWGPKRFDWRQNYAMHTWYRIWRDLSPYYNGVEPDPNTIKTMNNTFGEIARTVYYGSADLFPANNF